MTNSVQSGHDGDGGTSVALSATETSGVSAFLPKDGEAAASAAAPRPILSRLLDYSAHAAMIVGLLGFAWTISNHVVSHPAAPQADTPARSAAATPAKPDEVADLRQANQQMAVDIKHLRSSLDALRSASARDDKTSAQVRVLQAGLENVRSETTSAVAQLNSKLDKVEREPTAKLQQFSDRIGKIERSNMDMASTGAIPAAPAAKVAATVPTPPAKPVKVATADDSHRGQQSQKIAEETPAKPPVLAAYVVRDVYDGVAYIEGRRGAMEVVPGVSIPGAGIVKSIERQGKGWTVTTTKGLLAYAAPPKEYRRATYSRGFYPDYRGDF